MLKNTFISKTIYLIFIFLVFTHYGYSKDCISQKSVFSNDTNDKYSENSAEDANILTKFFEISNNILENETITRRDFLILGGGITASGTILEKLIGIFKHLNRSKTASSTTKNDSSHQETYSVEDMFSYLTIQNPVRISENGDTILYVSDKSGTLELWLMTPKEDKQLTFLNERVLRPKLFPDKKYVLFFADKGGNDIYDLYLLSLEDRKVKNITNTEKISESMAEFSPDGKKIAFLADPEKPFQPQIFLMDINTNEINQLTNESIPFGAFGEILYPAKFKSIVWSNDGKTIAGFQSEDGLKGDLFLVSIVDKTTKTITPPPNGVLLFPFAFSHDDNYLLAGTKNQNGFIQMCLINLKTNEIRLIGPSNLNVGEVIWHPTEGIIFTQSYGGVYGLYKMGTPDSEVKTIIEPQGVISELDIDVDGRYLQFVKETSTSPAEVFILDLRTNKIKQLTKSLPDHIDSKKLSPAKPFQVTSPDGTIVHGFYFEPKKSNIKKPYPAIVLIHGGPVALIGEQFYSDIQALCQAGFFVIAPNYRGSTGYGDTFQNLNKKDWGGGDIEDIKASAEFFIEKGVIDPKRIGITGASFGGYLTYMCLVKQPEFWAVGAAAYGLADLVFDYITTKDRFGAWYETNFGTPDKNPDLFYDRSPINFFKQLKVPLIIFHGENDNNVPAKSSELIVNKLKELDKSVEYVTYPDEGHGFTRRPNRIDCQERMIKFFSKHLKVDNIDSYNH